MLCIRLYEILHLNLLELACPQNKVAGCNFVAKRLADLGNTKRNLPAHCRLYIQKIDEDSLRGFRTKISECCWIVFHSRSADRSPKHHVEKPWLCQITRIAV